MKDQLCDSSAGLIRAQLPLRLMHAHDRAIKVSQFAGVGWTLVSDNGDITTGTTMHGYPASELIEEIHNASLGSELYLTCFPCSSYVHEIDFYLALKQGGVVRIHVSDPAPIWSQSLDLINLDDCGVDIVRYVSDVIPNQSYYGQYTLATRSRPWVTCIVSSQIGGRAVDAKALTQDALCKLQVTNILGEHHALVVDEYFGGMSFNLQNNCNASVPYYQVSNIGDFSGVLRIQAQLGQSTLCILASTELFEELVACDLVDNVMHYNFVLQTEFASGTSSKVSATPSESLALGDWIVLDSSAFSKGVRVSYSRKMF